MSLCGILTAITSNDFIVTILGWELFNFSLYILVSLPQGAKIGSASISSSLKYFLLSAFSTTFFLIGLAILFRETGSLYYDAIAIQNPSILAGLLISICLFFKMAAAPLHNWAPDLYSNLAFPQTIWMMVLPKIGVLFLLGRLLDLIGSDLLYVVGAISCLVGSFALISQYKIRRFLALSGVSHVGWILFALACSHEMSEAFLSYIVIYAITLITTLLILDSNKTLENISDLSGTFIRNKALGVGLTISMLSLAGIPPLVGFAVKFSVLQAMMADGQLLLIGIALMATLISCVRYLTITKTVLLTTGNRSMPITVGTTRSYLISVLITILIFGILY
jgi:proton-translocating NADH-quinone oxidoreductase chain N